ncbi:MAG TPA: SusC/RagA family TonB-linked outer membrane protein [Bacteroidales bacterium]|nr:SusC/RagA family TonB-linked outer membrane protein [Bacteroidales bacterium]
MKKIKICTLFIIFSLAAGQIMLAQDRNVTGTVTAAGSGLPLIGVTVYIQGTTVSTVTDAQGVYSITAESQDDVLVFSSLGFEDSRIIVGDRTVIDVLLKETALDLEEMVIIGYGKTTKKEVTGSIASLKPEDFNQGSFTTAAGLLQGKVAGLTVVNASGGDPNGNYEILLRGTNSLSAGQGPLIIIDGVVGADIRNINYQEVESIDVLKDGSAAAIYGTRGTNGVVIITTKRAQAGTTQVEYDGQVSVQTVQSRAIPLTAKEFTQVINQYKPAASGSLYGAETDWFKEITRTPISHKHSLALSGGSEKFSHRTVLNIEDNQGIQKKNESQKFLIKTNIKQSALQGWLDFDYNIFGSKRKYSPANYSAFEQAFYHNPTEPVYDPENEVSGGYYRIAEMAYYNPVAMINEQIQEREADDFGASVRATLNVLPIEGLKWDNFVSYNQQRYQSNSYRTRYYPSSIGQDGVASISNEYTNDIQYESTVNYSNTFNKHSVQAVLGYAYQRQTGEYSSMGNQGFDTDDWLTHNIGAGTSLKEGLASMYSYKESNTYIAFFGRVMYNYNEKYLASVSLRRDGSSRFGKDNKWGWFPAVSLGWRLDREEWLQDVEWISDLKLRAGYGVTGNQDFSNYKSLMLMKVSGKFYYNNEWINTYAPASNPNYDLAWEKKAEYNVGIDYGLFDFRLRGSIDYYYRLTSNLLYTYSVPTPPYVYDELFTNVGKISNQGIEVTISADVFKEEDLYWNTYLTFSKNMNKLIAFTNEEFQNGSYHVGWLPTPVGAYAQRLEEGKSLGSFYGPVWQGIDENGNDILKNAIGGIVSESMWENLGCAYPDFQLNWGNSFNYKNFDFSFMFRASIGGKVFNRYAAEYQNITALGLKNIMASWMDNTAFTGNVKYSSKYVEDATYVKLDNVTLGYTFDLDNDYMKKLRINLTGQNVFCITGYSGVDPEVSLSGLAPGIESLSYYPRTTVITLGVNLVF